MLTMHHLAIACVVGATSLLTVGTLAIYLGTLQAMEQPDHLTFQNLTYNGSAIGEVASGHTYANDAFYGQIILILILGAVLSGFLLFGPRVRQIPKVAITITLSFLGLMGLLSLWPILYRGSVIYTSADMVNPWFFATDGELWIDWRRGYRNFRTGGHHLRVDCPLSSDLRAYQTFLTDKPSTLPSWPLCADYYSHAQHTLFRLCCAETLTTQSYDMDALISSTSHAFAWLYWATILVCLLGLASHYLYGRWRGGEIPVTFDNFP